MIDTLIGEAVPGNCVITPVDKLPSCSNYECACLMVILGFTDAGYWAQVAELVDALASGASFRKEVEVRVFSWAPTIQIDQQSRLSFRTVRPASARFEIVPLLANHDTLGVRPKPLNAGIQIQRLQSSNGISQAWAQQDYC